MNFKILLPLVVSLFLINSTFALFTDNTQSTNNTFSAAAVFPTPTPNASPSPSLNIGDVVINEIMWPGSVISTADEWVELKNTTSSSIDLTNWVVEKLGDSTTPNVTISSGSIPANGFFLISNSSKASSIINVDPDITTSVVNLLNTGEQLVLKNNFGTIIDTANGSGAWLAGSSVVPHKSMERKTPAGDGTIASNWHTATTSANLDVGATESATPKTTND